METKPGDLDLWTTETNDKVEAKLYESYPTQVPHPVPFLWGVDSSSGRTTLERLWRTTSRRDCLLALERCTSGSARRRWKMVCGKTANCLTLMSNISACLVNKQSTVLVAEQRALPYSLHSPAGYREQDLPAPAPWQEWGSLEAAYSAHSQYSAYSAHSAYFQYSAHSGQGHCWNNTRPDPRPTSASEPSRP